MSCSDTIVDWLALFFCVYFLALAQGTVEAVRSWSFCDLFSAITSCDTVRARSRIPLVFGANYVCKDAGENNMNSL